MSGKLKDILVLASIGLVSTFLVWFPFLLRIPSFWGIPLPSNGMATIMANFDGLYYVAVAKTMSNPLTITTLFSFGLAPGYFAAHFPIYPILIKIFSPLFGYPWSMLFVPLAASMLATVIFYLFLKEFGYSRSPLWLSLVFLFLPARWLVVRSIGSPEPLFLLFLLLYFCFFKKAIKGNEGKYFCLAGFFGGLLQLTKPPGILLFLAYTLYLVWKAIFITKLSSITQIIIRNRSALPLLLIPAALLGIFAYYGYVYHDFWAYFHSGDNIHLFWPPFSVFNAALRWVGDFWLEDIIFIYLLGVLGVTLLIKRELWDLAFFAGIFLLSTFFIAHRDVARYSLPIVPFLLIAFEPFLVKKEFKIAFALILLPTYLYAINFIANNTFPIADWTPFLK